jgi:hypothetical protein
MNLGKVVLLVLASVAVMLILPVCGESQRTDQVENAGKAAHGTEVHVGTIVPCTLISKAQVEEIFGEPFQDGENKSREVNPLGQQICFWNTAASRSFRFLQISIIKTSAILNSTVPDAATIFRQTRENLNPIRMVGDVGDDAFWGTMGLHLLQGDVYIHITVGNSNRPGNLEIAKKVAAIGLGNLKK